MEKEFKMECTFEVVCDECAQELSISVDHLTDGLDFRIHVEQCDCNSREDKHY